MFNKIVILSRTSSHSTIIIQLLLRNVDLHKIGIEELVQVVFDVEPYKHEV